MSTHSRQASTMGIAAAPPSISSRCCFSSSMELRWTTRPNLPNTKQLSIPVFVSTNRSHVNPPSLRELFLSCNRSCDAFPNLGPSGRVEVAGVDKLRIALDHSPVVVSVFCDSQDFPIDGEGRKGLGFRDLVRRLAPAVNPYDGRLIGFGRAISDLSLTASICDVMVIPSLHRMGIGRMIVQRIVRMLTSRDIYDIAALCTDKDRLFFEACGFGDDILGSTTMMYTRTASSDDTSGNKLKRIGSRLLLVPTMKPLKDAQIN